MILCEDLGADHGFQGGGGLNLVDLAAQGGTAREAGGVPGHVLAHLADRYVLRLVGQFQSQVVQDHGPHLIGSGTRGNGAALQVLTDLGKETLEYFGHEISNGIQEDVKRYLKKHKIRMRNENAVVADYQKNDTGEFTARLQVKEKEQFVIDLALTVPLEQQAIILCDNWKKKNVEIYQYLMKELM